MIRCLQDTRNSLSKECQASLFDQEVKMAQDIDFKFPLKMACTLEIQTYCADEQHGHANIIRFALNPQWSNFMFYSYSSEQICMQKSSIIVNLVTKVCNSL